MGAAQGGGRGVRKARKTGIWLPGGHQPKGGAPTDEGGAVAKKAKNRGENKHGGGGKGEKKKPQGRKKKAATVRGDTHLQGDRKKNCGRKNREGSEVCW